MRVASCVLLAALTVPGGPAHAIESLTGTYREKTRCIGLFDGEKSVTSGNEQLWYLDDLGGGNVFLHIGGGAGWKYHGWLEVDLQKPDQGILGLVDCGIQSVGPQGEARVLRVRTKPGQTKAVLKGTGLGIRNFGASICSHTFTRISDEIPAVESVCP
jgi:hypothetical protein